jgi:hypothetical protein
MYFDNRPTNMLLKPMRKSVATSVDLRPTQSPKSAENDPAMRPCDKSGPFGHRAVERSTPGFAGTFATRLGVARFPEGIVIFDDGSSQEIRLVVEL